VKRFASVTFDAVLAPVEREVAARELASAGAAVTSWNAAAERTYAAVTLSPDASLAHQPLPGGRFDEPPLVVLRIVPESARRAAGLAEALGGPGRPAGIRAARPDGDALVVECEPAGTGLLLLLATIDAELATAPARRIEPLLPFDDATLTAFAGAVLGEPALDVSRLLETHLEPLLGSAT
jgi:hypothetical protein